MKHIIKKILKESDDLSWIQDVSDKVPDINQRSKIDLTVLLEDYMENDLDLLDYLLTEGIIDPTDEYQTKYTPEEWDSYGLDSWRDGAWKENSVWNDISYVLGFWEIKEPLEGDCTKWEHIDDETEDYDLEYGSFKRRMIFKRKSDRRYFALGYRGDVHDGTDENNEYLYEVFQKKVIVFV